MSSNAEQWTIGRLLTWTTEFLKRHGSQSARLDAEVLLAHARGCRRIDLYTAFHEEVPETVRAAFRESVRERSHGKPVAYLVGNREFYSLSFKVTPDVLIPRPETEFVVIALLDHAAALANQSPIEIADVGTGSGILAVCAAQHVQNARVVAIDVSEAALRVARRNAAELGVSEAIEFVQSDLFDAFPVERRFHFIVSNPPYVSEAEYESLARDVKEYEPRLALVSGPTGTETIERLIDQAATRLESGGWLIFEISPMIAARVHDLLTARSEYHNVRIDKDLAGQQRVAMGQRR